MSTSQVAIRLLSTVASRSPPSASLRSGTDMCASSPISRCRPRTSSCSSGSRCFASRRHWARAFVRSRMVRLGSPATCRTSSRPDATRTSARGRVEHLAERPHRMVELLPRVPDRVPDRVRQLRGAVRVGPVVGDEHHVEVGVRRELAPAVATDRHQGRTRVRSPGGVVRAHAQGIGRLGAVGSLSGCHRAMTLAAPRLGSVAREAASPVACGEPTTVGQYLAAAARRQARPLQLRGRRSPCRRCGPGSPSRWGSPRPCRRRSGRSGRSW